MNRARRIRAGATLAIFILAVLGAQGADLSHDPDYDYEPPTPGSYKLPVVKLAAEGAVLDSSGADLNLRDLTRGRITVLSFIYTRCAAVKACPYATSALKQLHSGFI